MLHDVDMRLSQAWTLLLLHWAPNVCAGTIRSPSRMRCSTFWNVWAGHLWICESCIFIDCESCQDLWKLAFFLPVRRQKCLFQELVITGWNVADGYLPPAKSFSWFSSDYWPSLDIHLVMSQGKHLNCITTMRSTSFKRNDDGFTNTYRTGNWAQTFGTWQVRISHVHSLALGISLEIHRASS